MITSPLDLSRSDTVVALSSMAVPPPSILGVPLSEIGLDLLVTDKRNEISFLFSSGPSSPVGHAILDRYIVMPLVTSGELLVFHPN